MGDGYIGVQLNLVSPISNQFNSTFVDWNYDMYYDITYAIYYDITYDFYFKVYNERNF
jgi:hypothetical protein